MPGLNHPLRSPLPVAHVWTSLGDTASLYPRGLGVKEPPHVPPEKFAVSLAKLGNDLYIEDLCANNCQKRDKHFLCTETDVVLLLQGPSVRAAAEWFWYLARTRRGTPSMSFDAIASCYLHVRVLEYDLRVPTVTEDGTALVRKQACFLDPEFRFHEPTRGITISIPRKQLQGCITSKHSNAPMRFEVRFLDAILHPKASGAGIQSATDLPPLFVTHSLLKKFAQEQGRAFHLRVPLEQVSGPSPRQGFASDIPTIRESLRVGIPLDASVRAVADRVTTHCKNRIEAAGGQLGASPDAALDSSGVLSLLPGAGGHPAALPASLPGLHSLVSRTEAMRGLRSTSTAEDASTPGNNLAPLLMSLSQSADSAKVEVEEVKDEGGSASEQVGEEEGAQAGAVVAPHTLPDAFTPAEHAPGLASLDVGEAEGQEDGAGEGADGYASAMAELDALYPKRGEWVDLRFVIHTFPVVISSKNPDGRTGNASRGTGQPPNTFDGEQGGEQVQAEKGKPGRKPGRPPNPGTATVPSPGRPKKSVVGVPMGAGAGLSYALPGLSSQLPPDPWHLPLVPEVEMVLKRISAEMGRRDDTTGAILPLPLYSLSEQYLVLLQLLDAETDADLIECGFRQAQEAASRESEEPKDGVLMPWDVAPSSLAQFEDDGYPDIRSELRCVALPSLRVKRKSISFMDMLQFASGFGGPGGAGDDSGAGGGGGAFPRLSFKYSIKPAPVIPSSTVPSTFVYADETAETREQAASHAAVASGTGSAGSAATSAAQSSIVAAPVGARRRQRGVGDPDTYGKSGFVYDKPRASKRSAAAMEGGELLDLSQAPPGGVALVQATAVLPAALPVSAAPPAPPTYEGTAGAYEQEHAEKKGKKKRAVGDGDKVTGHAPGWSTGHGAHSGEAEHGHGGYAYVDAQAHGRGMAGQYYGHPQAHALGAGPRAALAQMTSPKRGREGPKMGTHTYPHPSHGSHAPHAQAVNMGMPMVYGRAQPGWGYGNAGQGHVGMGEEQEYADPRWAMGSARGNGPAHGYGHAMGMGGGEGEPPQQGQAYGQYGAYAYGQQTGYGTGYGGPAWSAQRDLGAMGAVGAMGAMAASPAKVAGIPKGRAGVQDGVQKQAAGRAPASGASSAGSILPPPPRRSAPPPLPTGRGSLNDPVAGSTTPRLLGPAHAGLVTSPGMALEEHMVAQHLQSAALSVTASSHVDGY